MQHVYFIIIYSIIKLENDISIFFVLMLFLTKMPKYAEKYAICAFC